MIEEPENIEELIARLKEQKALLKPNKYPRRRKKRASDVLARKKAYYQGEKWRETHRKAQKRLQDTLAGSYKLLVRSYRYRNKDKERRGVKPVEFLLSLEDWKKIWVGAPMVVHRGIEKAAFYARGIRPEDVQLWRIDEEQPWRLDNVVVMFNGRAIVNGRKL